jgi:hypothetical protein
MTRMPRGVIAPGAVEQDVAAGHCRCHRIGAGLDAVGDDMVHRAGQPVDPFDHKG